MALIIQKYGGKALADPEDIRQVARLIMERRRQGAQLVIVVSAMGDTTDRYLGHGAAPSIRYPAGRELDVLLKRRRAHLDCHAGARAERASRTTWPCR